MDANSAKDETLSGSAVFTGAKAAARSTSISGKTASAGRVFHLHPVVETCVVGSLVARKAKIQGETVAGAGCPPPPIRAERMLLYLLPMHRRSEIVGCLAEIYVEAHAKFGPREARRLYWWHALRSVAPVLRQAAVRWSIVVALAEWLRRTFGS